MRGTAVEWIKSSRSNNTWDADCVELADAGDGVLMRNSRDPEGAKLSFTRSEIKAFVEGAKDGDFDHLT